MFHVSSRLVTLQGTLRTAFCCFGTLLTREASACVSPTLGDLLGLGAAGRGWFRGAGPVPTAGRWGVAVAGAARGLALAGASRRLGGRARLAPVRGAAVLSARLACRGFATTCVGLKR